ncbi:MAG TPA: N-acetyltransferase [Aliiroseovarius sp.]|nr:N-acetyltransferase [Aliiroseovarius sp.]
MTLTTPRLELRPIAESDWPGMRAFLMGPRAAFFGGPKTQDEARFVFDAQRGHWDMHGHGPFAAHRRNDDRTLGIIGAGHPDHCPEPELAWSIWRDQDEGHGYAFEAALAARDHFFTEGHGDSLVSYIAPDNSRSIRLARRLDCVQDTAAGVPFAGALTFRHPAPDADGAPEAYA